MKNSIFHLGSLYAGKLAGALIPFIFLPIYSEYLGDRQFGILAVILSIQAFLVVMDFGFSTLISREYALADAGSDLGKLIRTAEISLGVFYVLAIFILMLVFMLSDMSKLEFAILISSILFFWFLVAQNFFYVALLSKREYLRCSLMQISGLLIRALISLAALKYISSSLEVFLLAQMSIAFAHYFFTRYWFYLTKQCPDGKLSTVTINDVRNLLHQCLPLILFSISGAAVMQFDKPIISYFISTESVAPYFLAGTFSMVPIAMLASPISQFFQPRVLSLLQDGNLGLARSTLVKFTISCGCITAIFTGFLWLTRGIIVGEWLGYSAQATLVTRYVSILLPGLAIGALGYIPYVLLLSTKDYKFQACLSTTLTIFTLIFVCLSAYGDSVEIICWVYFGYHSLSTLFSWMRAMSLQPVSSLARLTFSLSISLIAGTVVIIFIIQLLI